MSRRSLRLQTSGGLYGSDSVTDGQNHGHSYSSSSTSIRRSARSRRQQQQAGSDSGSPVLTRKSKSSSAQYSHSGATGDSSLLSRTQEESSVTEQTLLGHVWGSNLESHIKRRSRRSEHGSTRLNGDVSFTETHSAVVNGYICKDCCIGGERKDALTAFSSSCNASPSSSLSQSLAASASSSSTVYSLNKSRTHRAGFVRSVSESCVRHTRRAVASIVTVITLIFHNLWPFGGGAKGHESKGVLVSVWNGLRRLVTHTVSRMSVFKQRTLRKIRYRSNGHDGKAHSSYCGSMNVKDLVTEDAHLNLNGSLCDDCKGKQHMETQLGHSRSSRAVTLLSALWTLVTYAGWVPVYCVSRAVGAVGAAGGFVGRKLLSVLWQAIVSPGKAVTGAIWWLGTGWYQLVALMSLLNVFILTRLLPRLLKLLLLLLPFLLLLGLWYLGPSSFLCYLPAVNVSQWREGFISTFQSHKTASVSTPSSTPTSAPTPENIPPPATTQGVGQVAWLDPERLLKLEQRVAALGDVILLGEQRQQRQHGETAEQIQTLREQLNTHTDRHALGLWVASLVEPKLNTLKQELEQQAAHHAQAEEQYEVRQKGHSSRLAELEVLIGALAAKTEELRQKQEETPAATPPAPVSVGMAKEDHDALLSKVQRLEAEVGRIRDDLEGVSACKGKCGQFDTLHETVSAQVSDQVRQELQAALFGGETAGKGELRESLLQWLSTQYISNSDLHATLSALERNILANVSLQLDQNKQAPCAETVAQAVVQTAGAAGLSEEDVRLMVDNALRLYSQDRTGLVDYALESGGGSILSTRCSETYETKTALMSLFGIPLWYFSQSPRVVIQPDVYPGNCWAFKGSQGYLVIRLSLSVLPTAFCLEHIPKALSPTGNISSAPRHFTVYGLDDEYQEEGKLLGDYTYQEDGESLQIFPVQEKNEKAFQIIEMRVLSNWGHPEYTCLYRFRVHGQPRV
ncbi:SUN domain-containing protein 1 isoform X2 [Chanos chanos]|nr:SUN domain-containing protein 1 isoform X2 [Chanos chanos]